MWMIYSNDLKYLPQIGLVMGILQRKSIAIKFFDVCYYQEVLYYHYKLRY